MTTTSAPRGWRRLPPVDLEELILQLRREATRRHLTTSEWRLIDRMRDRVTALRKEQY